MISRKSKSITFKTAVKIVLCAHFVGIGALYSWSKYNAHQARLLRDKKYNAAMVASSEWPSSQTNETKIVTYPQQKPKELQATAVKRSTFVIDGSTIASWFNNVKTKVAEASKYIPEFKIDTDQLAKNIENIKLQFGSKNKQTVVAVKQNNNVKTQKVKTLPLKPKQTVIAQVVKKPTTPVKTIDIPKSNSQIIHSVTKTVNFDSNKSKEPIIEITEIKREVLPQTVQTTPLPTIIRTAQEMYGNQIVEINKNSSTFNQLGAAF